MRDFELNYCFQGFRLALIITASAPPGKINKAIVSHQEQSIFFSEYITEDHEVSRPKSTELKSRDKYTLSFILRFPSKMFTRNELHWKKLENAEFILIIK